VKANCASLLEQIAALQAAHEQVGSDGQGREISDIKDMDKR